MHSVSWICRLPAFLILAFFLSLVTVNWASAEGETRLEVLSPDGSIGVCFSLKEGVPYYEVKRGDVQVIRSSRLGFRLRDAGSLDGNFKIADSKISTFDETWIQPWGEVEEIRNHYNELRVNLKETTFAARKLNVVFGVYDYGLGFRYEFPEQVNLGDFYIMDERTEFAMAGGHQAWWIPACKDNRYEYLYTKSSLAEMDTVHTPLTMETADGLFLSIHEANLTDYASTTLASVGGNVLECDLVSWSDGVKVRASTPFRTPWRTIQIAGNPGDLVTSYLILNLNEPNKLEDVSWISPGKCVGIWWGMHIGKYTWDSGDRRGATTENVKQDIDFAAENGFLGVLVEGWNLGWDSEWWLGGSVFDFTPTNEDFDIEELSKYAESRGVKIIGHHETSAAIENYERQADAADADWRSNPYSMDIFEALVDRGTTLKLRLAPGGGQAVRIRPATPDESESMQAAFPDVEGIPKAGEITTYVPESLYKYIDGAADVYLRYGFRELATQAYENEEEQYLTIETYRHADRTNAFGIYALERPTEGKFLDIGVQGYYEEGILNFVRGSYYVKLSSFRLGEEDSLVLVRVARDVATRLKGELEVPEILGLFPETGKIANSERFLPANFLGYSFLGNAFTCDYTRGEKEFKVFVMEESDSAACEKALLAYMSHIGHPDLNPREGVHTVDDPHHGRVGLLWHDRHIWGVLGLKSPESRMEYLALIEQALLSAE